MKVWLWIVGVVAVFCGIMSLLGIGSESNLDVRDIQMMSQQEYEELRMDGALAALLFSGALVVAMVVLIVAAVKYVTRRGRLISAAILLGIGATSLLVGAGAAISMSRETVIEYGFESSSSDGFGLLINLLASAFVAWAAISTAMTRQPTTRTFV